MENVATDFEQKSAVYLKSTQCIEGAVFFACFPTSHEASPFSLEKYFSLAEFFLVVCSKTLDFYK